MLGLWLNRRPEPPTSDTHTILTPDSETNRKSKQRGPANLNTGQLLRTALADVMSTADLAGRTERLGELRRLLEAMPADERRRWLTEFLDSRRDADLGGQFGVGPAGDLTTSPSLRVWLLNEITRLDPAGAAALGRQVLAGMDSPDEWAVALRAVALGDASADGRTLLKAKTLALLGHAPWQEQPTSGYLHAFDVAVHLKDREFAPVLSNLLRQTNQPALAHAAFLALDRLTMAAPVDFLRELQTNPEWLNGRETTRAGYLARADATDPAQRGILEQYLLDPRRNEEELNVFATTFPNASLFLSHNLLTRQATFDGRQLVRRDAATLAIVRQWLTEPRFAARRAQLLIVEARLNEFLSQASKQGSP